MARGLMEIINISPGQPVYVEDYRMQDLGFEWNVQNEFDYRIEYLMTNRVVMTEISSETLWGLSGWASSNSLKITQSAGNLVCNIGMADIGGRRYVRTSSGNISPTGTSGDDTYWVRVKYDTSTDTHTFVGESTSSPPQADTSTDKRVTLATAVKAGGVWTGTPVDKRTSNTQLTPPAVISGNAGSNPVLSLHQDGTGLGLLVTGGDVSVGDATYNQQLIVYGTSTYGITIYDDPNAYSVEMIAGAANTLKVQTIGGTAATITAANITAVGGPTISSTGIDMNTDSITNATGVTATTITGTSVAAGASGITSSGAISAPTATDTINGIIISSASINTGTWNATAVGATKGGTGQTGYTIGDILYANTTTTLSKLGVGASNAVLMGGTNPTWDATPSVSTITATATGSSIASSASVGGVTLNAGAITGVTTLVTSGNMTCGGDFRVIGNDIQASEGVSRLSFFSTGMYFKRGTGISLMALTTSTLMPHTDHQLDLGSLDVAWDVVYRQSEVTTSFVGVIQSPIEAIKTIKWDETEHLDHTSLPELIRTLRIKDDDGNEFRQLSDMHYDVDGMQMLAVQALQVLINKNEALEARIEILEAGS